MNPPDLPKTTPAALRLDKKTQDKIAIAARMSGFSKADIMRVAIQFGLRQLELINYDLVEAAAASLEGTGPKSDAGVTAKKAEATPMARKTA